jgi:lipopolysaccharide biosynthesis glycosyltransferase
MAFLRLYLGELLPDVDWVVYSDVDTLWYRDVAELWNLRDETKMLQWVQDIPSTRIEASAWQRRINPDFEFRNYGCSGVMLMNLKQMRSTKLLDRAVAFAK